MDEQTRSVPEETRLASYTAGSEEDGIFRQILDIAADAIVTVDEARNIVHFNRGAEQMFGYTGNEVLGKPLEMLLPSRFRAAHPAYVAHFGHSTETARLMGHRREVFGLRADGQEFPAEASILKLVRPDGGMLYTAVVRDVTERKQLDEQQRFLAAISAALSRSLDYDATLQTVLQLVVPRLGDACLLDVLTPETTEVRRLTNHAADESDATGIARALDELRARFTPTWESPSAVVDVLRTKAPQLVSEVTDEWLEAHSENADEAALMRRAGARSLLVVPLVARDEVLGTLTLLSHTSRRYDESKVVLATNIASRAALALENARLYGDARRASRARDEVLSIVSHDLRNPLSVIAMCSKVLAENPPKDPSSVQQLAATIRTSADWTSRLIQDLLDVAAIEAGHLSVALQTERVEPILARIAEMFAPMAADRKITLHVHPDTTVPPVHADAERLVQAVANLVGNAVKFTHAGGTVTVSSRSSPGAVLISVEDTGAGIAAADLPHIFERFWHVTGSSNQRGSGLGLAITKGIVDAHGGRIDVASTLGEGSTFTVVLPASGPAHGNA